MRTLERRAVKKLVRNGSSRNTQVRRTQAQTDRHLAPVLVGISATTPCRVPVEIFEAFRKHVAVNLVELVQFKVFAFLFLHLAIRISILVSSSRSGNFPAFLSFTLRTSAFRIDGFSTVPRIRSRTAFSASCLRMLLAWHTAPLLRKLRARVIHACHL